jgi:O-antigen/teichoic acid export membrane protein
LINNTFGATDAGLYSLAYNIGMLVGYVADAFQTALTPDWFKNMREKNYQRAYNIESKSYNFILLVALAGILFSREIVVILSDKRYHEAFAILPIIMFGYVFDAMTKVYNRSIGFTNKMVYVSITGLVASGVNVVLNLILIPRYGYIAGAYTTVASFLTMFLLSWWIAKYHLKQPVLPLWALWRPTLIFMVGLALSYGVSSLNPNLIISIFLRMCIWIGFAMTAFLTRSKHKA